MPPNRACPYCHGSGTWLDIDLLTLLPVPRPCPVCREPVSRETEYVTWENLYGCRAAAPDDEPQEGGE